MREIVYIQAGKISNYVGTHFWNTQESYFDYADGDGLQSKVDSDISFREGVAYDGSSTYCPRLVIFDSVDNFGALPRINDLYGTPKGDSGVDPQAVASTVAEIREVPIPRSKYQRLLDEEADHTNDADATQDASKATDALSDVRYWSDFNRMYYIPRTSQPLTWSSAGADSVWSVGRDKFAEMNKESEVMDEVVRPFVEECNSLQGFNTAFDTSSFGSFVASFLENVKDEYPRKSIISTPHLSSADLIAAGVDAKAPQALQIVCDAMVLRNCALGLSELTIPLQDPSVWLKADVVSSTLNFDKTSAYHTSAIVSAHLESATLPLRSKSSGIDLDTLIGHLNWKNDTPVAHLSGMFPLHLDPKATEPVLKRVYDFSTTVERITTNQARFAKPSLPFAQRIIVRSNDFRTAETVQEHMAKQFSTTPGILDTHITLSTFPAYPVPSSYPRFFNSDGAQQSQVPILSSLTTTSATAPWLSSYAKFVSRHAKTADLAQDVWAAVEKDDLRELAEDLTRISEAFIGEEVNDDSDNPGEYEIDA